MKRPALILLVPTVAALVPLMLFGCGPKEPVRTAAAVNSSASLSPQQKDILARRKANQDR